MNRKRCVCKREFSRRVTANLHNLECSYKTYNDGLSCLAKIREYRTIVISVITIIVTTSIPIHSFQHPSPHPSLCCESQCCVCIFESINTQRYLNREISINNHERNNARDFFLIALNIRSFSCHFLSFIRSLFNFSLDSCSRHFASFAGDKIMYVIIISHSSGREKSVLPSRVNYRFIFIHQRERWLQTRKK